MPAKELNGPIPKNNSISSQVHRISCASLLKKKIEIVYKELPPESEFAYLSEYKDWRYLGFLNSVAARNQGRKDAAKYKKPRYIKNLKYNEFLDTYGFKTDYDEGFYGTRTHK